MDKRDGVRDFLPSRRARLTPQQAGPERGVPHPLGCARRPPQPGSPTADALQLLAGWSAGQEGTAVRDRAGVEEPRA